MAATIAAALDASRRLNAGVDPTTASTAPTVVFPPGRYPVPTLADIGLDAPLGSIDRDKLNVNGSSLAAGHPFAATGGRIVASLAKQLKEAGGGRGLISICAAGGQGVVAVDGQHPGKLDDGALLDALHRCAEADPGQVEAARDEGVEAAAAGVRGLEFQAHLGVAPAEGHDRVGHEVPHRGGAGRGSATLRALRWRPQHP